MSWERKLRLLVGVAVGMAPAAVQARDTEPLEQDQASVERQEQAAPGDIIVTAQKRAESLQDVPLTVSVITGERLARQNITTLTELQYTAPELNYVGAPTPAYSIRGSGTSSFTRSVENNVLLVVDGVVQGQLTPPTTSLFDIARAEVLSGPQGMLFGKNASAGVVNIVTNAPELNRFSTLVRAEAGENGYAVLQGVVNAPISSKAAARITGFVNSRDSRITNRFNNQRIGDEDRYGGRFRLLWEATPDLTVNLNADYERQEGGNTVWQTRQATSAFPASLFYRAPLLACGVRIGPENTDVCLDGPTSQTIESYGGAIQLDWTVGNHTITSITANRQYLRNSDTDTDTLPVNIFNRNFAKDFINQFSQELRVASPSGARLEYVAGLFYYNYQYDPDVDQALGLGFPPIVYASRASEGDVEQYSSAIFGQATYRLGLGISLIAGGRFTHDVVKSRTRNFVNPESGVFVPFISPVAGEVSGRAEEDNFSWRLGVRYEPNDDLTLFMTYSRGYKGPAVNNLTPGVPGPVIVDPEIPTNFEIGLRARFFDRRVTLSATVYEQIVNDFQAQTVVNAGGVNTFVFTNADKVKLRGAQIDLIAAPVTGWTLNASALYNDSEFGDLFVQCTGTLVPGCVPLGTGFFRNVRGNSLPGAPKWKLVGSTNYETRLTDGLNGFVNLAVNWRDDTASTVPGDPSLVIRNYALVDTQIGLVGEANRWRVSLFARNLFDERAPALIFPDPLQPNGNFVQAYGPNSFRTIGGTLELRF